MIDINSEPHIKVGLMAGAKTARLSLSGGFTMDGGKPVEDGDYTATFDDGAIRLEGPARLRAGMLKLSPINFDNCRFTSTTSP